MEAPSHSASFEYCGSELELFAAANRWKRYVREALSPFIQHDVLEVGSGIGATTRSLCSGQESSWTCVEPDLRLLEVFRSSLQSQPLPIEPVLIHGTLNQLAATAAYDSILYIDVLEHIEDDRAELERAASLLKPGGRLIVLCPAHQFLFSRFDKTIGHFRRYSRPSLRGAGPINLSVEREFYLDSVGMLASLASRIMGTSMPTRRQTLIWDRLLVPVSRWIDPLAGFHIGKSVVVVWRRSVVGALPASVQSLNASPGRVDRIGDSHLCPDDWPA